RICMRPLGDWIVLDDGLKHDGVVGVDPERHLTLARLIVDRDGAERAHEAVEAAALSSQGAVVDQPIADVDVEQLIVRVAPDLVLSARKSARQNREYRDSRDPDLQFVL